MKNKVFILLVAGIFLSHTAHSQSCAPCNADTTILTPGFISLDNIPCIVQGEPYNFIIPFRMPLTLVEFGDTLSVDSVHLLDITNLPCGLCWSANAYSQPYNTFTPNQTGCIAISGTSMDTTGQFKLAMTFYGYFGGVAKTVLPTTLDTNGLLLIVRVVSPTGTCPPVDTSAGAQYFSTSGTRCATAVNDIPGYISLFDVSPNPLNSGAVISFTALQGGNYMLKLTDVAGKTIRTQQIQSHAGVNTTDLQRGNLPAGIYFISIGNNEGMITSKLIVAD